MENFTQNGEAGRSVPSSVADAVLKVSVPVADDARKVRGIEFDDFRGKDITVEELVAGMSGMGFQASAVADAVRIINEMVGTNYLIFNILPGRRKLIQATAPAPRLQRRGNT